MILTRLMVIFGALVVAFGGLLAIADDAAARDLWGGLSVASLGAFALAMAGDGISKGRIRIQFDVIERATRPRLFWAAVALVGAAGLGVWASAAWLLFFETS